MSEHRARIIWDRGDDPFEYELYSRCHLWRFENGIEVQASAATQFLGSADRLDPEEAYVASISSCHMLTFLAICARKRIKVDRYNDAAVGFLDKNQAGRLAITRVVLAPAITFGGSVPSERIIRKIHGLAHSECFIANSVTTEISISVD